MQTQGTNNRIAFFSFVLLIGLGLAGLRLFYLQLVQRSFLLAKARTQELHEVAMPARRGSILDRNGVLLAESASTESVFLDRRQASDKARLVSSLAQALHLSPSFLWHKLHSGRSFWVKREAPLEQTALLKKQHFGCLSFFPESKRVYPQKSLACHVLGFTNVDGKGLEGVERQYDNYLHGKAGRMKAAKDAHGHALLADNVVEEGAENGSDVVLTIDAQLQHIAERELWQAYQKYRAKWASMVVMDPDNGEILAMANFPNYDPNRASHFSVDARRNRAVTDSFEPGSTFKAITACLALENQVVQLDTPIDCHHGKGEFLGRIVRDHEDKLGVVPFREVIAQSSNVGTVTVALKLGKEKMYEGATRFGYGQKTGVDLPGETPGLLRKPSLWSGISMAAIPFGQEVSGNILHVAGVYAAIANGGYRVTPHVLKEVQSPSGRRYLPWSLRFGRGKKVLGSRVREELLSILKDVVDHGTGTPAALPGYLVAGKTGTAEKIDPATRRYAFYKNFSSFVGFVPADHPRFLCVVALDEPHNLTLGGWVAGPVFREACSAMLTAWNIPPDPILLAGKGGAQAGVPRLPGEAETKAKRYQSKLEMAKVEVPDLSRLSAVEAKRKLKDLGLIAIAKGKGTMVGSQFPKAGTEVYSSSSVTFLLQKQMAQNTGNAAKDKPSGLKKLLNHAPRAIVSTF